MNYSLLSIRLFKRVALLLVSALMLMACEPSTSSSEATAESAIEPSLEPTIEATELAQRMAENNAPIILDVRTADEFAAGHLPGAINIPHTEIDLRMSELPDADAEIVVHCQSGRRAGMAEAALQAAGYSGIRHLNGDYGGWQAAGLPLEQ